MKTQSTMEIIKPAVAKPLPRRDGSCLKELLARQYRTIPIIPQIKPAITKPTRDKTKLAIAKPQYLPIGWIRLIGCLFGSLFSGVPHEEQKEAFSAL